MFFWAQYSSSWGIREFLSLQTWYMTEYLLQLQEIFIKSFDELKPGFIYSWCTYNGKF